MVQRPFPARRRTAGVRPLLLARISRQDRRQLPRDLCAAHPIPSRRALLRYGQRRFLEACNLFRISHPHHTPDYHGHNSFNASELLGRGMAQGISIAYYPSKSRTASAIATKYAYALGRDALTNVFREFWPDIATHVLHRHP